MRSSAAQRHYRQYVTILAASLLSAIPSMSAAQQSPSMRLTRSWGQVDSRGPAVIGERPQGVEGRQPRGSASSATDSRLTSESPLPAVKGPLSAPAFTGQQSLQDEEPTLEPLTGPQRDRLEQGDALRPLQNRDLTTEVLRIDISQSEIGTGVLPESTPRRTADPIWLPDGSARELPGIFASWHPSNIRHNPLYFEDAMLERHGHVRFRCLQPIISGTRFLATIPLLPYLRTLEPKHSYNYTLGHYRPGTPAPLLKSHLPYDRRATFVESASVAGFFWAAPL